MKLHTLEEGRPVVREYEPRFAERCDVAVVGLGTAGAIAAIAAARQGRSVIGIEPNTYPGGVGTGGGVHLYCCGLTGGIQDEVDAQVAEAGKRYVQEGVRGFHPDAKKYVLERLGREAGVAYRYLTRVCGVLKDGEQVRGIQVAGPEGVFEIGAHFVIDASGDADVCVLAGCETRFGREFDDQAQPYSMPRGLLNKQGQVDHANFDAGYVDPRSGEDYSEAICRGHTFHLPERFQGDQRILYLASHPGLREGRFVVGEETLGFEEVLSGRLVPNPIIQAAAFHDNHSKDFAFESDLAQIWVTVCGFFARQTLGQVPYGAIIPRGAEGLLVAGRCISLDHDSASTMRMQRDMQTLGEAAGIAAALAIEEGCGARAVPYARLRSRLLASGCLREKPRVLEPWLDDLEAIRAGLASEAPGLAIWSARLLGLEEGRREELLAALRDALARPRQERERIHAALALGVLEDPAALPVLREMVIRRDTGKPKEKGWVLWPRCQAALFLLGRLGDREILPVLLYGVAAPARDFQEFSHVLAALLRIGQRHSDLRAEIAGVLVRHLGAQEFRLSLALQNSSPGLKGQVHKEMTDYLRLMAARELERWGIEAGALRTLTAPGEPYRLR